MTDTEKELIISKLCPALPIITIHWIRHSNLQSQLEPGPFPAKTPSLRLHFKKLNSLLHPMSYLFFVG